ncbi:unnamed protein product [Cylindrotheca closterium]|uniref:Uncharacterized protein n=1 Tax=Cylindrotheca closterium TaxID=2856 RepID=A0AAD2FD86_9STRA|nr:unnamed protein product [Cylindrotheca closterium]
MAPNDNKTPGNKLDDAIDSAKTQLDNVHEKVNETTKEQKEAAKSNAEKAGDALPNSAEEAGSKLGGMVDSGVQKAKNALSGNNEKK